ncbi:hypothetical protein BKA70DRAFT_1432365 [Coprinopsis sp. MPI-PUGE-AT-0042]|nr:hypothetical protein BKA70DRAFT_1432365 [Coprinopsis sp. MPI-PUGE-AT-0042]
MSEVSGQEVDHNGRMKAHRGRSDAEGSPGFEDAAPPRSRGNQERDNRDWYTMAQPQAAYAQELVSQVHDPEDHGYYVDGRRSSSPNRRQGRTYRLCDYQGMIRSEYAVMEVARGARRTQRIPVEESEVDEQQGEGEGAGCLEVLKPGIKRLFGCANRNKTQKTHMQGSLAQKLERTDKHRPAPRRLDDGMPSPRSPDRQGYIPFQEDWRWREGSRSHPVPNGVPNAHVVAQGVGPGGQASSPASLQPANVTITPSMFSAAETVNISGGHFYTAETVIVQHIYQNHPPNSPTTRVL